MEEREQQVIGHKVLRLSAVHALKEAARELPELTHETTDLGNAGRMMVMWGDDIRYCYARKRWYVWDGRRWSDREGAIEVLAKGMVRTIGLEAEATEDTERRKALGRWAHQSQSRQHIEAAIKMTCSEPGVPVELDELDQEGWLLNVRNGTLELGSGELREHRREDLITKMAGVEYDASAQCPGWIAFLERIMDGNQGLVKFLQRAVGYSLTASTVEQCLFICYGTGANGKSTLLEVVS